MKVTKYPQSCLMVETNNKKILIDAGGLKYQDKFLDYPYPPRFLSITLWYHEEVFIASCRILIRCDLIFPEDENFPIRSFFFHWFVIIFD